MNNESPSSNSRKYSSRLREEQAEATRERILASVAALLRAGDLENLSFGSVAKHAGVSVPTVYRYFPSRSALFEGVQEWIARELKAPTFPDDVRDLAAAAADLARYYEGAGDIFRTAMVASLFRDMESEQRRARDVRLTTIFEPLTAHLDERQGNAVRALLRLLWSFNAYQFMTERFGVTPAEAGEAIAWTTRSLIAQLERDQARAAKKETAAPTTKRNGATKTTTPTSKRNGTTTPTTKRSRGDRR